MATTTPHSPARNTAPKCLLCHSEDRDYDDESGTFFAHCGRCVTLIQRAHTQALHTHTYRDTADTWSTVEPMLPVFTAGEHTGWYCHALNPCGAFVPAS